MPELATLRVIFFAGGWVMWPLLVMSLLALALAVERALFWSSLHSARRRRAVEAMTSKVRAGDLRGAAALAEQDASLYGRAAAALLDTASVGSPAAVEAHAFELIEAARRQIDRFAAAMSAIITAAPMLGILGTVTGIIRSFRLLGVSDAAPEPSEVAAGIAEALYTTAFGLIIALITLFPHVLARAQSARCVGRLEALGASAAAAAALQRPAAKVEPERKA